MSYIIKIVFITATFININSNPEQFEPRKITILGTGYVGLVTGVCLASFGHEIICADIDSNKIGLLQKNIIPIYEPGLAKLLETAINSKKISFTDNIETSIQNSDIIFIAVGTPMNKAGKTDLTAIEETFEIISENLNKPKLICMKSTVPIGTCKMLKKVLKRKNEHLTEIAFNPEFLKEGSAISDFLEPDRLVLGGSNRSIEILKKIYLPLIKKNVPVLSTDTITAETIKYASNSFLATKISYINEIARLCDVIGADCNVVAQGMGLDKRIGDKFLKAGPGYGGSCFPKDSQELLYISRYHNKPLKILEAVIDTNNSQCQYIFEKFLKLMDNNLENKTIAILGLSFKPNTDDVRYSPAIDFIHNLQKYNCKINAYDPIAIENMRKEIHDINYIDNIEDTCKNVDGIVILTEWQNIKDINLERLVDLVNKPVLFDTRNIINTDLLKKLGYKYTNIGNAKIN